MLLAASIIVCLFLYSFSAAREVFAPFFKSVQTHKQSWKASLALSVTYSFAIAVLWLSLFATDVLGPYLDEIVVFVLIFSAINVSLAWGYYDLAKGQKYADDNTQLEVEKQKSRKIRISDDGEIDFELDEELKDFVDYK